MASFIIHKPRQRSSFTKAALKTVSSPLSTLLPFDLIGRIAIPLLSPRNEQLICVGSIWSMIFPPQQLESIGALEKFMLKHRKDYVDLHRTTEQERDSIEHEVSYGVFRMLIQAFDSSSLMLICHSICLQKFVLSVFFPPQ